MDHVRNASRICHARDDVADAARRSYVARATGAPRVVGGTADQRISTDAGNVG